MLLQDVVGLQHAADQAHQSFRKVLAFRKLESVRVLICTYAYLAGARPFTKCWHTGRLTQSALLPLPRHAWNWLARGWCAPSTCHIN